MNETVETTWSTTTKEYYIGKGYNFTKIGDKLAVYIADLKNSSNVKILVKCDICGKENEVRYSDYKRRMPLRCGDYVCSACSCKNNNRKTKLEDSIYRKNKWMMDYIVNDEDAKLLSFGSNKNVDMKCPICGYEKRTAPVKLYYLGFCCPNCNKDGFSYPEKIVGFVLKSKNIKYIKELSSKDFKWCSKYRYDFFIPSINCIIETHGIQHYKQTSGNFKRSFREEQENDKIKRELALSNGIKNYIELNCSKSEVKWIKNSIRNSELPRLLNLKEEDVDWVECDAHSRGNLYIEVIKMIKEGFDFEHISNTFNVTKRCVYKYRERYERTNNVSLNRKNKKGYGSSTNKFIGEKNVHAQGKSVGVFSISNMELINEYKSISELCRMSQNDFGLKFGISSVSKCCNGITKKHKGYIFKFIN